MLQMTSCRGTAKLYPEWWCSMFMLVVTGKVEVHLYGSCTLIRGINLTRPEQLRNCTEAETMATALCSCCLPWSSGRCFSLESFLAQVLHAAHRVLLGDIHVNEHISLALPLLLELFHFHKSLNIH